MKPDVAPVRLVLLLAAGVAAVMLALAAVGLVVDEGPIVGLRGLFIAAFALLLGLLVGLSWRRR